MASAAPVSPPKPKPCSWPVPASLRDFLRSFMPLEVADTHRAAEVLAAEPFSDEAAAPYASAYLALFSLTGNGKDAALCTTALKHRLSTVRPRSPAPPPVPTA